MAESHGDCFEMLCHFVMHRAGEGDAEKYTYVHGVVTQPITGLRHVHAWAEFTDTRGEARCLNLSGDIRAVFLMSTYYVLGCIDESEVVKYSVDDMMAMMLDSGHYGPWDQYLCEVQCAAVETLRGEENEL